jgi:maleylacetate reductase
MLTGSYRATRQEQVLYGRPAAEAVADLAGQFGAKRLLVVTTRSLDGPDGAGARLQSDLGALCVGRFSAISAHSPRESVVAGAAAAREAKADLIVAIGGGSVIDAAKVMQLCLWADLREPGQLDAYRAGADLARLEVGVRMIAVPTTLSAAEFTPFAGVTDVTRHAKEGFAHPAMIPRAVVLDPAVTLQTPEGLWFSTGIKAVDHAVEQLCNPTRQPFADGLAEQALKRLARVLPASKADFGDVELRLDCQIGAWLAMAGAVTGRGLGASHAIGHTLGGSYGAPHGLTSCVALPAVLKWNAEADAERQAVVSDLMGQPGRPAGEVVEALCHALGLPTDLKSLGIGPGDFHAIAEHTLGDRGVKANPRPIRTAEDIVEILELA